MLALLLMAQPGAHSADPSLPTTPMQLYYIADPMCGWCYGFTPVMLQLQREHAQEYNITFISGGMITGNQVGPMPEAKRKYISSAYKRVEDMCGIKFGAAYVNGTLQNPDVIQTSVTPSIALEVIREVAPQQTLEIFHDIQLALFSEGLEPAHFDSYKKIAERYGIKGDDFISATSQPVYADRANEQFELTASWGISGFPALVASRGDSLVLVTSGYTSYATLLDRLQMVRDGQ
ncbi:MAG: DsbA family protein [Flavobacteriales bacterium]|nr:DsbA family protein [Flavobacteriales bacterium]